MKVYDSLEQEIIEFKSIHPNKINMYICGPTVYDSPHLGHARSEVVFDMIRKYFEFKGYEVKYVHNFTDVDDKVINRANERGISIQELTDENIAKYKSMQSSLLIKIPTVEPRATEEIEEMLKIIQILEDKEYFYVANGSVYFDTSKFPKYKLIFRKNMKIEEEEEGENEYSSSDFSDDKKNKEDFVLWKKKKEGEPFWPSKWGDGRPGWHIECSAMSNHHLGKTLDIHGGGMDLKNPHHQNEIAQSEAANGQKFANYWLHNGFLNINHEKMSKSLGNFITISDLLKEYSGDIIRYYFLTHQYRKPIDFTPKKIAEAKKALRKLQKIFSEFQTYVPKKTSTTDEELKDLYNTARDKFIKAMDNDFNTPKAIGILFSFINSLATKMKMEYPISKELYDEILSSLVRIDTVFGFIDSSSHLEGTGSSEDGIKWKKAYGNFINDIIPLRDEMRKNKQYNLSDKLRDLLNKHGIIISDNKSESSWEFKE